MSIELGELTRNYGRFLMLNSRKTELALSLTELGARRTTAVMIRIHLLDQHWGHGHRSANELEKEVAMLDSKLGPLRSEYDGVCAQINLLVAEMKRKGYDLTS